MEDFISGIPPAQKGSYRIRNTEGRIIFWGDSENLFVTWCGRMGNKSEVHSDCFEYALQVSNFCVAGYEINV